jgi:hypothetical protein
MVEKAVMPKAHGIFVQDVVHSFSGNVTRPMNLPFLPERWMM